MLKRLIEDIYSYLTLRTESIAYTIAEEGVRLIAKLALLAMSVLMSFLILIFLSIALGFGFGRWLGIGATGGFFVVVGIYLLFFLIGYLCRHLIRRYILGRLAGEVLEIVARHQRKKEEDEEPTNK
ncbi:hypothetical protein [Porphyromonas gingivalis]|uniref:hypothetical protein n=1 Tax=Porphyromonas gingivalis TaxID=837 RepID=UPI000C1A4551|nr:hypothetical protein [Porphyromonas gingivalis]ATS02162.1 hypothetical protein CS059_03545 [Porphyromonas gingivalis]